MGRIEQTVELPATPQRVWDVAADPAGMARWLTMHRSWDGEPPEQIAVGDRVTAVVAVAELPFTITWTVEEYTPPSTVRLSGVGLTGVAVSLTLTITPNGDDASTAAIAVQFDGQLVTGPIGQAVERAGRQELDASAAKLRALLA